MCCGSRGANGDETVLEDGEGKVNGSRGLPPVRGSALRYEEVEGFEVEDGRTVEEVGKAPRRSKRVRILALEVGGACALSGDDGRWVSRTVLGCWDPVRRGTPAGCLHIRPGQLWRRERVPTGPPEGV